MRKKLARYGIVVILVAFAAITLVSARTGSAGVVEAERSARAVDSSSQATLTLRSLLQSRLGWTRQLLRALRFLDLPPAPPSFGTHTIIDEPDPAGYSGDPPPPEEDEQDGREPPAVIDAISPSKNFQQS